MIDNQFEVKKQIGKGGSSTVFSANDYDGQEYAIKIIRKDKNYSDSKAEHFILRENLVLERIGGHPNIVKSISCSTDGHIEHQNDTLPIMYQVLELCQNGSLYDYVKHTGAVEENIAKFHLTQVVSAIKHMHSKGFAHLDIKLDNLLLDEYYNAKIADLGCSHCVINTNGQLDVKIGTPNYIAPEIETLENGHSYAGLKADIYSLGVTLHILLTGGLPTDESNQHSFSTCESGSTKSDTSENTPDSQDKCFSDGKTNQNMTDEAMDLLSGMLAKNPNDRMTIDDVIAHPWFSTTDISGLAEVVFSEYDARKQFMKKSLCNF
jgi:serine/threonine protein kinase